MTGSAFRNRVAIVGVGVSKAVRHAEVPVGAIAARTADDAIADAGLTRADIDGVACGTSLPVVNGNTRVLRPGEEFVDSTFLIDHLELDPVWWLDAESFTPALAQAVQAVASGVCTAVLVNRTLHNPPGRYNSFAGTDASGGAQWTAPFGASTPVRFATTWSEYQQRFGATREDLGALVCQVRANVQRIPDAYWYGRELTLDEYMGSRVLSDPLCIFDSDIPVDGSGSFVVTTAERARDLPHTPVHVTAWAKIRKARNPAGIYGRLDEIYDRGADLTERLWRMSGWGPGDLQVVQLYDGFAPFVWWWLETLGFCPVGEGWKLTGGGAIAPDGPFPLNSGGGNLGWGRMHGIPHVLECYLQLAGRAGGRQIAGAERALSTHALPSSNAGNVFLFATDPAA